MTLSEIKPIALNSSQSGFNYEKAKSSSHNYFDQKRLTSNSKCGGHSLTFCCKHEREEGEKQLWNDIVFPSTNFYVTEKLPDVLTTCFQLSSQHSFLENLLLKFY